MNSLRVEADGIPKGSAGAIWSGSVTGTDKAVLTYDLLRASGLGGEEQEARWQAHLYQLLCVRPMLKVSMMT